ncbi:ferric reductase like transmembrane component-domain-containing protein [Delphinella strobiligena]|nr:ferric reductase like transmembrane component-domain-containing protein [Delphinella strobiligena]
MGNNHIRHLLTLSNPERQRYWARNHTTFWPRIKKHLLYAPLFRTRHNRELQLSNTIAIGTLPSRFHTLILTLYILSNVAYCLILDWNESNSASVIANLRGRSGQLAALNLIPTILFALRNNPLIPLLRVSYDTFNLLHRWCARVVVVESIVHTAAYLVNTSNSGAGGRKAIGESLASSVSFQWGMVATVLFTVMIIQAFAPIRHAFYEVFINVHRLLALVGLVGVYVHLEKAGLPQLPYIKLVFGLWGAEWFLRFIRLSYYNMSIKTGLTKVTIEALPAEACRVTFELARPWTFIPGSHVHAYLPAISQWGSHPFSVAWAETKSRSAPLEIEMEKLPTWNKHQSMIGHPPKPPVTTIARESDGANSSTVTHVSLIIRAREGMTRKLFEKASASPTGQITMKGAIEGPYGGHESLSSFGTVVLFAGGVGITHCVGYVYDLLKQYNEGTCSTRKILLVWSVPNTEALEWARPWMDHILKMEGRKDVLRVQLFVTKPRHQNEVNSRTGTVQMFPGRCNPTTIIEKEVSEQIGAMGVVVCGPGAFADSVRSATRNKVDASSLCFIEEGFTY